MTSRFVMKGMIGFYIFLFFLYGGILQNTRATDFFSELGKLAGRKLRGGPAQTAVVSSALVGSVTGSAIANVAITGGNGGQRNSRPCAWRG